MGYNQNMAQNTKSKKCAKTAVGQAQFDMGQVHGMANRHRKYESTPLHIVACGALMSMTPNYGTRFYIICAKINVA